jgi:type I restriction enzyme R subunit
VGRRANRPIQDLTGFTKTFFAKHTLLNVLTKYCVLTADRMLLVMRPYQIVATERILQRIETPPTTRPSAPSAGGYVWHTTGLRARRSPASRPRSSPRMPSVDKVLFVVDRKDLDYQTMREYDRFEKGAANSNTSTAVLKKQLEDPDARIIITTIQKLATFIGANKGHAIYDGHIVHHLRRVPPLAVRRHAHRHHQGVQALPPVRLHRHPDLRRQLRQRRATRS